MSLTTRAFSSPAERTGPNDQAQRPGPPPSALGSRRPIGRARFAGAPGQARRLPEDNRQHRASGMHRAPLVAMVPDRAPINDDGFT